MSLTGFREARGIKERTLHSYIAQGLPTVGEGRGRKVVVADADAWLANRMGKKAANDR